MKAFLLLVAVAAATASDWPYGGGPEEIRYSKLKQIIPVEQPEYPHFEDGLRQLQILEAEMASNRQRAWLKLEPKVEEVYP